ncbi:MAG: thioesterase family protein [Planctomycetes bacterium]|nr:thioesterase family protein [Planctomycetota bacterium]
MDPFYTLDGAHLLATSATRGPWSPVHQHGGPPAALLAREMERHAAAAGMQVVRFTVEFLRPIPITRVSVQLQVVRPGKKRQLLAATLVEASDGAARDGGATAGGEIARASGLCLRTLPLTAASPPAPVPPLPPPQASAPFEFPFFTASVGYHTAMELRIARGRFGSGAMAAWMRMRVPLIAGEEPSPLVRTVVAADSGNGISLVLDVKRWTFLNPDLTVYLHRPVEGEWVGLDAFTAGGPGGIGMAECALHDRLGPVGRSIQSLLIEPR